MSSIAGKSFLSTEPNSVYSGSQIGSEYSYGFTREDENVRELLIRNAMVSSEVTNLEHGLVSPTKLNTSGPDVYKDYALSLENTDLRVFKSQELQGMQQYTKGRMGVLYKAKVQGREVVVKLPRLDVKESEECIIAVTREINVLRCCRHPNIVSILGAGYTSLNVPFMVQERIYGRTLDVFLGSKLPSNATKGNLKPPKFEQNKRTFATHLLRVLPLAQQLASALNYLQANSLAENCCFMHRDLKPDNIMVTTNEYGMMTLKLIDFGLAKAIPASSVTTDERYKMTAKAGSLRYMCSETACGRPYNGSADVYSYTLILWEMIVLQKPYGNLTIDTISAVFGDEQLRPPLPLPGETAWSVNLLHLLTAGWAHVPEKRPSFSQFLEALELLTQECVTVVSALPSRVETPVHTVAHTAPVKSVGKKMTSSVTIKSVSSPGGGKALKSIFPYSPRNSQKGVAGCNCVVS